MAEALFNKMFTPKTTNDVSAHQAPAGHTTAHPTSDGRGSLDNDKHQGAQGEGADGEFTDMHFEESHGAPTEGNELVDLIYKNASALMNAVKFIAAKHPDVLSLIHI